PVIDLFQVTPKEVILGDNQVVKLTWSVSGQTTNVEITAPNFQLSGLKAQEVITVTPGETTLYVLTAYNGELSTSAPAEVTVLLPTPTATPTAVPTAPPTPTPTPTPFPPPVISYFKAEGQDPNEDKVTFKSTYEGQSGPVYVYEVEASSRVRLTWGVKDADVVELENLGTQPAEGSLDLPGQVVAPTSIMLTAINNEGQNQKHAVVQFEVTSPPPPSPPPNVTGIEDPAAGTNRILWSYRVEERSNIDGFRIYRTDVPPGTTFSPVWTVYDPNASEWTDHVSPTCGKGYYVVAIYTDPLDLVERETAASLTSWYSQSCP
ncbi:MAG: hypothetical protein PVF47_05400, partial [Anaerolineae bacterium]